MPNLHGISKNCKYLNIYDVQKIARHIGLMLMHDDWHYLILNLLKFDFIIIKNISWISYTF
jgi:hypothetical protein